jgi:hypothetical protein
MKRMLLKRAGWPILILCALPVLPHETLTTTVLFDREIVRILDQHCVMCHAENGPSFPLETYDQTWLKKRPIHDQVIARHMPPWAAVPGYGQFINDNSLTLRETQFLVSWVEGLGPRNSGTVFLNVTGPDAARPPEVRAHTDFGKWQLGEPQLVRPVPANTIEPQASVIRRTVIDLGLKTDRRLRALEYMPGDRRVVRAAFFTIQETGQWIGSWTPWYGIATLPNGLAFRLPAGSHVVAEIHYKGAKEQVVEHGNLGMFFDDSASSNMPPDLVLEAATPQSQKFRATTKLVRDTRVLALRPEVSAGAKSIEVSARRPDGGTEILLFAKDFSPDWPTPYIFKTPVALPPGTDLSVPAYYANDAPRMAGVRLRVSHSDAGR